MNNTSNAIAREPANLGTLIAEDGSNLAVVELVSASHTGPGHYSGFVIPPEEGFTLKMPATHVRLHGEEGFRALTHPVSVCEPVERCPHFHLVFAEDLAAVGEDLV